MNHRTTRRRRLVRRVGGTAAAAGIAITALTVTATAASASETCRSDRSAGDFNCFSIDGFAFPNIRIGINITMSPQDAQAILDCPGQQLTAALWGSDTFSDDFLTSVPLGNAFVYAGPDTSYLGAEFTTTVDAKVLDEDWDGTDEVYGRVSMHDCRSNRTRTFNTNEIEGDF
jgi:hypothetical protein